MVGMCKLSERLRGGPAGQLYRVADQPASVCIGNSEGSPSLKGL